MMITQLAEVLLCQSLFFNKVAGLTPEECNFIKKETLTQAFCCEFYEISNKTFFTEHLCATTFINIKKRTYYCNLSNLSDFLLTKDKLKNHRIYR